MEVQRFMTAGWAAAIQTVLFPAAIIIGIVQTAAGLRSFPLRVPIFGLGDALVIIFAAIAIYTLIMFRKLLNEIHNYKGLDTLITVSICWIPIYYIGGMFTGGLAFWSGVDLGYLAVGAGFGIVMTMFIGVVDIFIAVRLFKLKERNNELLTIFAILTMIMGICEVSVIFSLVAAFIYPLSTVVLSLLFFEVRKRAEFV